MDIDYRKDPVTAATTRPEFFETPGLDRLYAMFVALTEQLAITNERQDTLKQVLIAKGLVTEEELAGYEPSQDVLQQRQAEHEQLVSAILKPIEDELTELAGKSHE